MNLSDAEIWSKVCDVFLKIDLLGVIGYSYKAVSLTELNDLNPFTTEAGNGSVRRCWCERAPSLGEKGLMNVRGWANYCE